MHWVAPPKGLLRTYIHMHIHGMAWHGMAWRWHGPGDIHRYVFAALDYALAARSTCSSVIRCDSYDYCRWLRLVAWDLGSRGGFRRWVMSGRKIRCDHVVTRWRPKDKVSGAQPVQTSGSDGGSSTNTTTGRDKAVVSHDGVDAPGSSRSSSSLSSKTVLGNQAIVYRQYHVLLILGGGVS